jgi:hypothetical protein
MLLSYSFDTGMTSGYVKAMEDMGYRAVLDDLVLCANPVSHPFLLPILTLCNELSAEKNDKKQRDQRKKLRELDDALIRRYSMQAAPHYRPDMDPELDNISQKIAVCQTEVLQRRPQAWQNVIDNVKRAAIYYWDHTSEEKKSIDLKLLHESLMNRLDFLTVKLQGIESYAFVTLERLSLLREVVSRNQLDMFFDGFKLSSHFI